MLESCEIPNYKVVEGRSSRIWTNQNKAFETLQNAGIEKAIIYDSVPKSLSQLEKLIGNVKFNELVGKYVFKPQGKPTPEILMIKGLHLAEHKRTLFNGERSLKKYLTFNFEQNY